MPRVTNRTLVTLVGESNPYGGDDYYALYPYPDGCAGQRLCCRVLGMSRKSYIDSFIRTNLCRGPWSMGDARGRATEMMDGRRLVLCGSKVSRAFGLKFDPFTVVQSMSTKWAIIPHPSGLCRIWNEEMAFARARETILSIAPELAGEIGRYSAESHGPGT